MPSLITSRDLEVERAILNDPSLVLYLPLYKLDGASFMSRDAYGHLATVTGALWRPNGRYFDGVDDHIIVPHHASLDITDAITIEAWCKFTFNNYGIYIDKERTTQTTSFGLWHVDSNAIRLLAKDLTTDLVDTTAALTEAEHDLWWHVVGRYDGATLKVFLNGEEKGSANSTGTINTNSDDLWIGEGNNGSLDFEGTIGEVGI